MTAACLTNTATDWLASAFLFGRGNDNTCIYPMPRPVAFVDPKHMDTFQALPCSRIAGGTPDSANKELYSHLTSVREVKKKCLDDANSYAA